MNIYNGDKIEIDYDSHDKEFIFSIYDTYGHYIDTMKMSKEDVKLLHESLEKVKGICF